MKLEYGLHIHTISIKLTFLLLSLQVGFMTGPRPMTLHFILVASVSCWEALFCCWQPCPPGKHATSNSPSQHQQPFCTKLPQMFRGILEGSTRLFSIAKFHCGWLWMNFKKQTNRQTHIYYSLCSLYLLYFFSSFFFSQEVGLFCFVSIHEFLTL